MNGYLLDSSIVIEYTKGNKSVVEIVDSLKDEVSTSYIVLAELYEGIYRSKSEVEENILGFIESLDKIYSLDKKTSKMFGKIRTVLKREGKIIEDMDIFLAATCLSNNLSILTLNDKHFKRVDGLEVFTPNDFKN